MLPMRSFLFFLMCGFLSLTAVYQAQAQGTTSASMSGSVTDQNGDPLPGATIIAIHEPTGSQYGNVTNADGRFRLVNMQVGGPYTVTATFVGYSNEVKNDINLALGQTRSVPFIMSEQATELAEVQVLASSDKIIDGNRNGAVTEISTEEINNAPTASRNLNDFIRLTPQSVVTETGDGPAISIAGQNNRFNSIYIDGAINNDVFGLAGSGTNGGQTGISPISIDAIEQFQVVIAPYDVTIGGFTGGGINAVTRSGSNEFEGSAYYFWRNEQLAGKTPSKDFGEFEDSDRVRERLPEFAARTYGFRVGGPIVQDKLFFFVNAELQRDETPQPLTEEYRGSSLAEIDALADYLRNTYDYDPGGFRNNVREQNGNKFLAKLDWNINQQHKLTVRHSYSFAEEIERDGSTANSINFANGVERFPSITNSTALELNSTFGNNFANNLIVGYTRVNDDRGFVGDPFPYVSIRDGNDARIQFGNERFSVGNLLEQDVITLTNNFNWFKGDHTVTFGTHNEYYSFNNLFLRENFGYYQYDSLSGFLNDLGPNSYDRTYEVVGQVDDQIGDDASSIAAQFRAMQLGFYIQDEFQVNSQLQLTGGLRLDIPFFLDGPVANPRFNEIAPQFEAAGYDLEGARSGQVPEAQFLFSPRFGFNYDVLGDETLQVRGGLGIFTGRTLFVWPGGSFTNNGTFLSSVDLNNPQLVQGNDTIPLPFRGDAFNQYTAANLVNGAGEAPQGNPSQIDLFAQDFRYPQVFRTSLAVDYQLPYELVATVEGILTSEMNPVYYQNVNVQRPASRSNEGPGIRPVYGSFIETDDGRVVNSLERVNDEFGNVIVGKNGEEGYSYSLTAQLQKPFSNNWSANLSYTYSQTRVLLDATSSQNSSNWQFIEALDKNNLTLNDELGFSDFDAGSRILASVAYRQEYAGFMASTLSLFYNGQSGDRYSNLYFPGNYPIHGRDGGSDFSDLIYIPASREDINLIAYTDRGGNEVGTQAQWQALDAFIENDPYLSQHRGEYDVRNSGRLPFTHVVDLKFLQDFYITLPNGKRNTLQLSVDIFNFTNLLNKEWGRRYNLRFGTNNLVNFEGFEDPVNGNFTPQFTYQQDEEDSRDIATIDDTGIYSSRWQMQLGLRYIFGQ